MWTPLFTPEERNVQATFVHMMSKVCRRVATECGPHLAEQVILSDFDA